MLGKLLAASACVSLVVVIACDDKKSPPNEASKGAPKASVAATGAATTASTGASVLHAVKYSDKLPGKGANAITQQAIKGGSGDTRPSPNSKKTSEAATDRQMRKEAKVDVVDCKPDAMDNAAECEGQKFFFCDDHALFVVDCNEEAKFGGATEGSCFEGEKFIDCLGSGKADDGSTVWCNLDTTTCCDEKGGCYSPKG